MIVFRQRNSVAHRACGASKGKAWQADRRNDREMNDGKSGPCAVLCFASNTNKTVQQLSLGLGSTN